MAPRRKARYYRKRTKYSVEQTYINVAANPSETTAVNVVPATTTQGMRKIRHLTIQCALTGSQAYGFLWALMYLPEGVAIPAFNTTSGGSLVEPNQYVMNCGTFDNDAGPLRISSRIGRNLNSGDRVVLLLRPIGGSTTNVYFTGIVRYAIGY